jgi:hypothetical protein
VLGTVGYKVYEYWDNNQSSGTGDQFIAAMKLADENKSDEALAALDKLEKEGHGDYPILARLRAASVLAQKGDTTGAVAAFDVIGKDAKAPQAVRDAAKMRAGWLLIEDRHLRAGFRPGRGNGRSDQRIPPFRSRSARPCRLQGRQHGSGPPVVPGDRRRCAEPAQRCQSRPDDA